MVLRGPCLRACGLDYDLRKQEPYSVYDRFEFEVPVGLDGDSWDRHYVRVQEMYESLSIVEQAVAQMPGGGVASSLGRRLIRPPAGEIYVRAENPRGEIGVYLVSDGTDRPYRVKVRTAVVLQPLRYQDHAPGRLGGRFRGDTGFFGHCAGRGGPVSDHLVPIALIPMAPVPLALGVTGILWDTLALLILFVALSVVVLSLVWLERKVLGRLQRRLGPTRTGPMGLLQPVADAVKLILKEDILPASAERSMFWLAPVIVVVPAFMIWVTIPAAQNAVVKNLDLGLLYITAFSGGGYFGAGDGRLGIGQQICHPGWIARGCPAHQL